jgi:hypothetical protein
MGGTERRDAELVLGPLLRYTGEADATVWVETDAGCEVEVLGCSSRTFRLGSHHYAIVHVTGLQDAREYEVRLDGDKVWPEPGSLFPPSVIRPMKKGETLKLAFGSCRISAPHEPPYTLDHDEDERDLGNTRLLMIDSRGGRVLREDRRSMVDAEEWAWVSDKATGSFDHLLICTSLPLLLGPAMHHLQSWDERLCSGTWGERAARWAEGFRRSQDLDHRASFHNSFAAMVELIGNVASGEKGAPPSTVLILSGDVHHGYLAEATLANHPESRIYQAVCSPLRNALPREKSFLQDNAWTRSASLVARLLARLARIPEEPLTWRLTHDAAFFDNQIATLELEARSATITFEKCVLDSSKEPALEKLYRRRLA